MRKAKPSFRLAAPGRYAGNGELLMRILTFILLITANAFSQNLTEFGAVAAGSAVGGASGKSVSNGISAIFGKVDQQTAKAASKTAKKEDQEVAVLKVARGVPSADTGGVPLPPQEHRHAAAPAIPVARIALPEEITRTRSLAEVATSLPPPPEMSAEEFRTISNGMSRADLLKLGAPASKITMFDEGHLVEIYSYRQNGQNLGALRLTDGAVSSIQ